MATTKILVVEDESIVAQDIRGSLKRFGYEVCATVASGEDALEKAESHRPDLALMDIVLAGEMDGIETADHMRSRFDIPVVYLTSHTDDATLAKAGATDPLGYIVKPFTDRELKSAVEVATFKARLEAERKRAVEALGESELRFRQLAENIEDIFWISSPDWNQILYVSPAYETIWGRSCASLYDDPRSWLEAVHEEDRELVIAEINEKANGDYDDARFPAYRVVRPDGTIRWILTRAFPIRDAKGNAERVAGIAEDITDRKRAEEAIRTLARFPSENPNPVLRIQHDGTVVYVNQAGLPLLDCWETQIGQRVPDSWRKVVFDVFRSGQKRDTESECKGRIVSLTFAPVVEAGYVNVYGLDITERKRAGLELALQNKISEVFLTTSDDAMYSDVLKVVLDAVESEFGFFGFIDEDGALVCPSMTRENWDRCQMPDKQITFPREKWGGLWGRALIEKRTFCSNQPLSPPEGHLPLDRALVVPLVHQGKVVGQIAVANKPTDYGEWDQHLVETAAAHIAPILDARLQSDIQYRARMQAEDALRRLRSRLTSGRRFAGIVGNSPKMLELFETIREVARVSAPVLIQGESGTGKELVASAIHTEGPRADRPFIPVNCGALPENLLESELFGHVRGSFSGAIRDKKGRFELADGGTIFLDEVGELSPAIQVKLLRALQEGTFERVGGEQTIKVNVRLISATNKNLAQEVAAGRFREDLYYRLCVLPITLPPLRERRDDISLLAAHILTQLAEEETGGRRLAISEEALDALVAHEWPGNVRQLQNAIHFAATKCREDVIELEHLPLWVLNVPKTARPAPRKARRKKLDRTSVELALRESNGNKKEAAKRLGVSRATLYRFLDQSEEPAQASAS